MSRAPGRRGLRANPQPAAGIAWPAAAMSASRPVSLPPPPPAQPPSLPAHVPASPEDKRPPQQVMVTDAGLGPAIGHRHRSTSAPCVSSGSHRISCAKWKLHVSRVRRSCSLQNAVLLIGILSIGLYVFEAVLFSTFIFYNASAPTGTAQDTWVLSVCGVQVIQGVVGAVLSGFLLRGALREERRWVLAWLVCAGLGVAFLFKACVIETLAVTSQGADQSSQHIEALTRIAVKCAILFVQMLNFVIVHAFYMRLRHDHDPPPYHTIA